MSIYSKSLRMFAAFALVALVCISMSCSSKKTKPKTISPTITSTAPTTAAVGLAYSYTITVTGNPAPSLSVSGLPGWLSFDGINLISGTPAAGDAGTTETITVTASNGTAPDAIQTFNVVVALPVAPAITSIAPITATVGTLYSYTITTTGNPTPTVSVSGLPSWLLYNSGNQTVSGTPAAGNAGMTGTITVTATNGVLPNATQTFTIDVYITPAITSTAPTTATVGTLYSYTITATGNPVPSLSVTDLPAWLSFDGVDLISGTPTAGDVGTTGTITVTASNGISPDATQLFTITVSPMQLTGLYVVVDLQSPYAVANLSSSPADLHTNDSYKTTKLVLKRIPAGTFQMGDQTGAGDVSRELPFHSVSITKDFFIGVFEVTQRQWFEVMGTWPSFFTSSPDKRPVEYVSWNDIKGGSGYIDTLSGIIGVEFDLPTEAEWEYCCKAGTTTNYSYGDTADGAYMWYAANTGGWPDGETKEVGTRLPNPWSLYDMHGNVIEWCLDWYSSSSENPPSYYQTCYDLGTVSDPMGPTTGSLCAYRGGNWIGTADYCRSAYRFRSGPVYRNDLVGFRLCAVQRD